MVRGIERRAIFRDDRDRADFVRRLAALAQSAAWTVYAWALLPNHAHLLVRTARAPLARATRSLLTGYAGAFNRRHHRHGHLFQNRYKSIVVEEEPYFLELVRYLHLNPLRARVVADLRALDRYSWSGHGALVGRRPHPWQDTRAVWARFAATARAAQARYRAFVAEGIPQGRRPDLQGGGLRRSLGGWEAVRALRRGREAYRADERILGGTDFVERLLREAERGLPRLGKGKDFTLEALRRQVCRAVGVRPEALAGGGRQMVFAAARAGIAYLWVDWLGRSGRALAPTLGIRPEGVYKALARGRREPDRWRRLVAEGSKAL